MEYSHERAVADHNPEWFQNHQEIFKKMTDGMFEMEYDEAIFRTKLYQAIGFLGRNLRYSDSPSFSGLQYFIQRYLNDAAIDIEFQHAVNHLMLFISIIDILSVILLFLLLLSYQQLRVFDVQVVFSKKRNSK
jgi:hypothetical protein